MTYNLSRYALGICAGIAVLSGCGGSQPPIGAPHAVAQASAADRGKSWMLPEAKGEDLLYASSGRTIVSVFSYPTGKLVGTLSGFSGADGECVDKAGDVFIANTGGSNVLEYSHGGSTPINTLSDQGYEPYSCSVDSTTGNLAVSNFDGGSVAVYSGAQAILRSIQFLELTYGFADTTKAEIFLSMASGIAPHLSSSSFLAEAARR